MILGPLYNVENENQSQNPAHSNVSNPPIFGTVPTDFWWGSKPIYQLPIGNVLKYFEKDGILKLFKSLGIQIMMVSIRAVAHTKWSS